MLLLMVTLRPERVVLKKVKTFSLSLSMSISESLESLPSLYSLTWFSSWSDAEHTESKVMQGPKLTFLYRRQVATENFFSVAK